jgi:hypothetical protein
LPNIVRGSVLRRDGSLSLCAGVSAPRRLDLGR